MFRRRLPPLDLPPPPEMSPAYDPSMDRRALAGMVNAPPVGPGMAAPPRQGMFGRARNWLSQQNEQGLTGADRLYAVGGALKDLDWTSGGGHFDAAMQRNDQQRAQYEQEQARRQYAEAMQQIFADGQVTRDELEMVPGLSFEQYMDFEKANRPEEPEPISPYQQAQLDLAERRYRLAQEQHNARVKAGGYGTPGVGGYVDLGPGWELLP